MIKKSRKKRLGQTMVEYMGILGVISYWVALSLPYVAEQMTTLTNEVTVAMEMAAGGSSSVESNETGSGNNGNGVGGTGTNRSGGGDGTNPGGGGNDTGANNPNQSGR